MDQSTTTSTSTTSSTPPDQTVVTTTAPSSSNKMMPIIALVILLALALGAYAMYSRQQEKPDQTISVTQESTTAEAPDESTAMEGEAMAPENSDDMTPEDSDAMKPENGSTENNGSGESMEKPSNLKEFNVDATEFKYSLTQMKVKKGEIISINLVNKGKMPHDLVVDEFNTTSKQLAAGESENIIIVASKTGTFEFYCSVGDHREKGMKGTIIVE